MMQPTITVSGKLLRLEWAMERKAIADLVIRPQTVIIEDISVALAINVII